MGRRVVAMVAAAAIASPAVAADLSDGIAFTDETFTPTVEPTVKGDIELSLGWLQVDGFGDREYYTFQGWGRANLPLGNTWNFLVETGGGTIFGGDVGSSASNSNLSAVGHLWGGDGLRYGAFGGVTFDDAFRQTFASVGLEAEADIGNATLGAQGFYSWMTDCPAPGCNIDVYGASASLDYYFGPNTKLNGEFLWARWNTSDITSGFDIDVLGGSGRLTHRFAGTPINVFAEGAYWHVDGVANPAEADVVRVLGGFTIVLDGNGTQQAFDGDVPFTFRGPPLLHDLGF